MKEITIYIEPNLDEDEYDVINTRPAYAKDMKNIKVKEVDYNKACEILKENNIYFK